jgi:riboflavin synthase
MFTGIIEEVGALERFEQRPAGARLTVRCRDVLADLKPGSSIAVNGACLTAVEIRADSFSADLAPETLRLTNLGDLRPAALVNLERPLSATGRLDGHFVQGHIDATGDLLALEPLGHQNWWLRLRFPREIERYVAVKGSIAIDGISLTVAALDADVLSVAVIPHTYQRTALRARRPGDRLNLECDILAKYLETLLRPRQSSALTFERLDALGY